MNTDFFHIFGLEPGFVIDAAALSARYRQLQQQFHPDRYAGKSQQEVRLAVQSVSLINQAYDTLKSPLRRAEYLLQQQGVEAVGETTVNRDVPFLVQQMELREQLQEVLAAPPAQALLGLEQLAQSAGQALAELENDFDACFTAGQFDEAAVMVAKMQFFAKLLVEIQRREEELDNR